MSDQILPALDAESLYAKSQVYINRGFRAQSDGDLEEYQLWASLALELLGKSALARVHPSLIADPQHYQSLFAACGREISTDVRTIAAKTLFERLRHIAKSFDSRHNDFCLQLAIRRNAELHSGESPFTGMSPVAWEREFWGAVETVLNIHDQDLETWLGVEESKAPAEILKQANDALKWAVKSRTARCREDFENKNKNPQARQKVLDDSKLLRWFDRTWDGDEREECPACQALAFIGGTLWDEEVVETHEGIFATDPESDDFYSEPPSETVQKTFSTEIFDCPTCKLRLYGTKEIKAANLKEEFTLEEIREREFEPEYGNE